MTSFNQLQITLTRNCLTKSNQTWSAVIGRWWMARDHRLCRLLNFASSRRQGRWDTGAILSRKSLSALSKLVFEAKDFWDSTRFLISRTDRFVAVAVPDLRWSRKLLKNFWKYSGSIRMPGGWEICLIITRLNHRWLADALSSPVKHSRFKMF